MLYLTRQRLLLFAVALLALTVTGFFAATAQQGPVPIAPAAQPPQSPPAKDEKKKEEKRKDNRQDSVVEFYNNLLDNYFITAEPVEQAAVDNGAAGPGWSRTGDYFNAGGATKVCRFYGSLSPGPNSHFYTIDPAECQLLKDLQATTPANLKRWNFESNDFSSASPVGGGCGSGTMPVYRAYNNGFARGIDSNHRITANNAAYLAQVARGWIGEGIVLCAPAN